MAIRFTYIPSHSDGTMERPTIRFTPTCTVEGCEWTAVVNGMCIEHAHVGHIDQPRNPRDCFDCAPQINAWLRS